MPSRGVYADLFTIGSALVLILSAFYMVAFDDTMDINLNALITGVVGLGFGLVGLLRPLSSRLMSFGAAAAGLNGVLYYLDIYAQACIFDETMTAIFWISALAAGGLFVQVVTPRARPTQRRESSTASAIRAQHVRTRVATGTIVLYTVMIFLAFIAMVPFLWMIATSFMTLGETINRVWVPGELQVCNYHEAWDTARFRIYFSNSIIIAITTIVGLLIVSILSAYAFARIQFFGRGTIFTLLLATLMVPEIVVMIPNYLTVNGQIFPIPVTQDTFPFLNISRGQSWVDTLAVLSIPFMGSAFSIFLLRQFFAQIPHELWEAARIDGAGHLRFLIQIVIPISRPAIMTVTLLTFIGSWNSLLWPLLVTRDPVTWRPISYGLQAFSDEAGTQTHLLTAGAFITILPMLVLYFLTQKTFTEGIATTGLKG
ncbi:MAG: carbohydrate ABC transporter permease [Chloroflexota bacterium]